MLWFGIVAFPLHELITRGARLITVATIAHRFPGAPSAVHNAHIGTRLGLVCLARALSTAVFGLWTITESKTTSRSTAALFGTYRPRIPRAPLSMHCENKDRSERKSDHCPMIAPSDRTRSFKANTSAFDWFHENNAAQPENKASSKQKEFASFHSQIANSFHTFYVRKTVIIQVAYFIHKNHRLDRKYLIFRSL